MSSSTQDVFSDAQNDKSIFTQESEEISFADETETSQPAKSWKILIVDDDIEVHKVTELALSDFTFEEKSLSFISAYSAQEAKHLIQAHADIAIIFLDVVMETETAGLQVIKYVREELGNLLVRIILRTGQPGQAPENVVVVNYGIDDYKTKTELTAQKLFITVITALRAFSTLMQMLEMSQALKLELIHYKQVETNLQSSEILQGKQNPKSLKAGLLERSLQVFQQDSQQFGQHEKIEVLGQLVTEITHGVVQEPNQSCAVYTMSIIARIARMVLRITDEHSAKLGISQSKLAVLLYLSSESEPGASPSSIAKHCGVSRAAMTGLLDGLEQDGYVERDDHPSDRRALRIKMTQKGQQFLDWIAPQDQYWMSEVMDSLDEAERRKLIDLVVRVIKLFDKTVAPDP
ncbi:MAG: MarR family transcriptional regulator [Drouetiella hepatica Uher 2000/2452]|jgi:DNA-binding MarR family transcriptional regulator/response regulator of citrate/malate metabolism|uniref:MarR family transcriptional regulator n=1 Tax=Drouetiella hepatica Uher 2000/2452 TaxID=904376 RepID=A0A951QF23_9CYAN|nr:MarR family transcriptional regulator [Drouetiella hepatica Uher 2000/2452]